MIESDALLVLDDELCGAALRMARGVEVSEDTLAEKIRVFSYATSLGHAHSLLFYYPTDLYVDAAAYLTGEQKTRIKGWVGEGIVRASIGLEDPQDLIEDLDQALRGRTFKAIYGPLAYQLMKK